MICFAASAGMTSTKNNPNGYNEKIDFFMDKLLNNMINYEY